MSQDIIQSGGEEQTLEGSSAGGSAKALREEAERQEKTLHGFFAILQHSGLSAETLSGLSKDRDSFALAWLLVQLFLRVNSAVMKRPPGLLLLQNFLEYLLAAKRGGKEAPQLKAFTFAGNRLGREGFKALAEVIESGHASSLLSLDLENTGLDIDTLKIVCDALLRSEKRFLSLETLNLSENPFGQKEMEVLSSVLCNNTLPNLRVLILKNCLSEVETLAGMLQRGDFANLETLDLERRRAIPSLLSKLARALHASSVPRLRYLNLLTEGGSDDYNEGVSDFFRYLKSGAGPRLEHVKIRLGGHISQQDLRAVAAGQYPAIRTLGLCLESASQLKAFMKMLLDGSTRGSFDSLEVVFDASLGESVSANDPLCAMGGVIEGGRLDFLQKLVVYVSRPHPFADMNFSLLAKGKGALLQSFCHSKLPLLSELSLTQCLSDGDLGLLAKGVRKGNLIGLRSLLLGQTPEVLDAAATTFGGVGFEALMHAVIESTEGLPLLEKLEVSGTRAGERVGCLGDALLSGKLPRLSVIGLAGCNLTSESVRLLSGTVRRGAFAGVSSVELNLNREVGWEAWNELMGAIGEGVRPLRKLTKLNVSDTTIREAGGAVVAAFASGNLPVLRRVGRSFCLGEAPWFNLDASGVQSLGDAVRDGKFPRCIEGAVNFGLKGSGIGLDSLIVGIAESRKGLPRCVEQMDLSGGRVGEEALGALSLSVKADGPWGRRLPVRFPGLAYLYLNHCGMNDNILSRWGDVFAAFECPQLKLLHLNENRFTIDGISSFIDILRPGCLPQLTDFSVQNQDVAEGKMEFDNKAAEALIERAISEKKVPASCQPRATTGL
uniref:Uncharacterized protein n=1 Tax=Chromera velia CCMP2878 TaxID=1169474 RepID=A0A0G4FGY3_9ALVE|eukprot:Cvel_16967.t1-p1 / transcript=Cvel_16967.t1 / gene=Cvel_16967 / organism=Chromera_velia_CCMP2878 / gene_product=hypothetical protein / transcript_product=hypothetical protein / location=Cvel_scaffold1331:38778-44161(+) / protein_length=834 / sequence_SO=supercontig / SO=protein_coding / is_pseudo=false